MSVLEDADFVIELEETCFPRKFRKAVAQLFAEYEIKQREKDENSERSEKEESNE